MAVTKLEIEKQKNERLGKEKLNYQGCLMKIIEYNKMSDILIEFQDEYKTKINTRYDHFIKGDIKNPYSPSVFKVGIVGNKYPISAAKEYGAWVNMLRRCCDEKYKNKKQTYKNAICCKEWLLYENFYEWLHSQENFNKWYENNGWHLDKDILIKGNNIYSSDTCCLVPNDVNILFKKSKKNNLPVGVEMVTRGKHKNAKFIARCGNKALSNNAIHLGTYNTIEEAFSSYKKAKEERIKQVAQEEYNKGNITKQCYDAMMNYEVEITD